MLECDFKFELIVIFDFKEVIVYVEKVCDYVFCDLF